MNIIKYIIIWKKVNFACLNLSDIDQNRDVLEKFSLQIFIQTKNTQTIQITINFNISRDSENKNYEILQINMRCK